MSRRMGTDSAAPAAKKLSREDRIAKLKAKNAELERDAKIAEDIAAEAAEESRLKREQKALELRLSMATATLPDGELKAGQSLIYPDQTALSDRFKDPSRMYYWANPGDTNLVGMGYVKDTPPRVLQPDGSWTDHPMVLKGMVLWSTPLDEYNRRKGIERGMADTAMREASDMKAAIPDEVRVDRDELPTR